jgi:hypothetical protein
LLEEGVEDDELLEGVVVVVCAIAAVASATTASPRKTL